MNSEKILTYVSFAVRSNSVAIGADQVLRRVRRGKGMTVILSCDASSRTVKQISDKCDYYSVPLIHLTDVDMETLGKRCGKVSPVAVICVTNISLSNEIVKWSNLE